MNQKLILNSLSLNQNHEIKDTLNVQDLWFMVKSTIANEPITLQRKYLG